MLGLEVGDGDDVRRLLGLRLDVEGLAVVAQRDAARGERGVLGDLPVGAGQLSRRPRPAGS
jgi:hypothetical protein